MVESRVGAGRCSCEECGWNGRRGDGVDGWDGGVFAATRGGAREGEGCAASPGGGGYAGGRRGGARDDVLRELRGELHGGRVLDRVRHLREVVSREVREDHACASGAHQAVQVPGVQQQKGAYVTVHGGGSCIVGGYY